MFRTTLFLIAICCTNLALSQDIFLRNSSGNSVRVKVKNTYKDINNGKIEKFTLDNLFKTEVKVFYQRKEVAKTTIRPSSKDLKFKIYREKGAWLIKPEKY